ncbi:ankyrin repeat domain-containing protein [Luteimonas sp. 100069]|uniref:ankyrin repeat domain-containing protein n=1 Tax=Luteimonas sp. 100069 TaxID=2006109 RepID=UPI000F4E561F|nr:ankyrin repeat domain-containing protein [Luteimonas sp. 100069]RPD85363.1 ankyrin repeat domain-containing protein [Luteimonas sp. 100069]
MRAAVLSLLLMLSGAACSGDAMDARAAFSDASAAALAQAVGADDAVAVRAQIHAGADPNARGDEGVNLLQLAMLAQAKDALRALLQAGADPNAPGLGGATAMHGAAIADDPEFLEILLANRGDPDARHGITGATPLAGATGPRTDAQFRRLLAAGADPGAADRTGNTPLHKAAMINAGDHVLALLEAGADPLAKNSQDASFQRYFFKTPPNRLNDAARGQRQAVVAWLRTRQVPLEADAE